jgi:hypothetical protein
MISRYLFFVAKSDCFRDPLADFCASSRNKFQLKRRRDAQNKTFIRFKGYLFVSEFFNKRLRSSEKHRSLICVGIADASIFAT